MSSSPVPSTPPSLPSAAPPVAVVAPVVSERKLIFLLASVQFINIVDFMMVMPLGPDFAKALAIKSSYLGLITGSYTGAAAIAGLIAAQFVDRFDRRRALFVAMLGLVVGTVAGGFSTGLTSMLLSRVVAGAFGGPATALTLSILTDAVPPERRGKALGALFGSFSVASVVGVPAGLELARLGGLGGWRAPFFVIGALGVLIASASASVMPAMRGHLGRGKLTPTRPLSEFLVDKSVLLSFAGIAVSMMGTFAIVANLSSYIQFNLGYPREHIGILYTAGGVFSFLAMRVAGKQSDKRGPFVVVTAGTVLIIAIIGVGFLGPRPLIPVIGIFIGFMTANPTRMVALNALTSRVPAPQERGRFMSLQSTVQHLASAIGAGASTWILHERPDRSLSGMPTLALGAMGMALTLPLLVGALARRLAPPPNPHPG